MATFNTGGGREVFLTPIRNERRNLVGLRLRIALLIWACWSGDTKEEGFRIASQIMDHIRINPIVASQYTKPPGYYPVEDMTRALRSGTKGTVGLIATPMSREGKSYREATCNRREYIDAGIVFAGTPDMVVEQIREFVNKSWLSWPFVNAGQAAWLSHEDTVRNLTLFSRRFTTARGLTEASETPVRGFTAVA